MREKTSVRNICATAIVCWLFWLLITGQVTALIKGQPSWHVLLAGAVVSAAVAWFSARFFIHSHAFFFFRPLRLLRLLFFCLFTFPAALIRANVDVAIRALKPSLPVHPGIVRVPVSLKGEYAQAMLADSITLTPGTITLDIAEEDAQTWFYIHWIDVQSADPEEAGAQIKGKLEQVLRRVWE